MLLRSRYFTLLIGRDDSDYTVLMMFIPCSYEAKFEELDAKNQQFQEDFRQKSQDQHNAVTLYTKTLEQKGVCFINLL